MKAILEFNLPEEQQDFELAANGYKWQLVVSNLDNWMRNEMKYHSDEMSRDTYNAFYQIREELHIMRTDIGLELD